MRCLRWLCLLLVAGMPTTSFAGDVQVICGPALRVYLDGAFIGNSSARDDGLFLAGVADGAHVIRVEKAGFVPQSFQVEVQKLPIEVRVEEFSSEPPFRQERETTRPRVERSAGNLLITSAPQNCVVEIDGRSETKSIPLLLIEGLAAGEHLISFSKPGYGRLSGAIKIQPGAEVRVRGDLKAGRLEAVTEGQGSLRVISVPEYCTVRFLGMTKEKTDLVLNVSHVPAGEHRIVVAWGRLELSSSVVIIRGQRAVVTVSFMKAAKPFVVSYEPE